MPIITGAAPQAGSFTVDNAYIYLAPTQLATPSGPNTQILGVEGSASWGPLNTPLAFVDAKSLYQNFGTNTSAPFSLVSEALNAMPECQQFLGSRISDGSDTAATTKFVDNTGFATGTNTVAGTPAAGNTVSLVIVNGTTTVTVGPYTLTATDTVTTAAAALVALGNAGPAVTGSGAFLQAFSNVAGVITAKALVAGVAGNSITMQGVATGGGATQTPNTATALAGGAAAGTVLTLTGKYTGSYGNSITVRVDLTSGTTAANPFFAITVNPPNSTPEVFQNIQGSVSGGAYSSVAFIANALAAVNGTGAGTTASNWVIASSGASTNAPYVGQNFAMSGGTDGILNITTANLIGTDGNTGRTGIYAFRGALNGGLMIVSSLTDPNAFAPLASFALSEGLYTFIAFPTGTSTTSAVATKQSSAMSSKFVGLVMDWDYVYDPIQGKKVLQSPLGKVAGIFAQQPAYLYSGNKPYNGATGVIATDRSGFPVSLGEASTREQNGLMYLTNPIPRGAVFGLPHALSSDGSLSSDTRMLNYIALTLQQILGQFVGEMQTQDANDLTRSNAKAAINAFMQSLITPVRQISNYQNILDSTNNTTTTIQQGFLNANILVQTLSAARFVLAALQVGNAVQVTVRPSTSIS